MSEIVCRCLGGTKDNDDNIKGGGKGIHKVVMKSALRAAVR